MRLLRENGRRKKLPLSQAHRREDRPSVVAHRTWGLEEEDGLGTYLIPAASCLSLSLMP